MAKNIEPNLKKIGEYLNIGTDKEFLIPDYQRAYSWQINQCDKLWQDITEFIDNQGEDPYFFGTIIVNMQENDKVLGLIDGQQRTTTFILLLKAMLIQLDKAISKVDDSEDSRKLKSGLDIKRNNIIKLLYKATDEEVYDIKEGFHVNSSDLIIRNESINELYKDELSVILFNKTFEDITNSVHTIPRKQKDNKYTNFYRNFKFFYEKLDELSESQLNTFADYVLNKSEIIEIKSWNVEQAITMFNSLNSDGMPLSDADIIAAKLYAYTPESNEYFRANWEEFNDITTNLESSKILTKDSALQQLMYVKRAENKEILSQSTDYVDVTTPGIRRYYTEINSKLLKDPDKISEDLLHISHIWDKIKDYSIIRVLSWFSRNYKMFLMTYLFKYELDEIDEKLVTGIGDQLLRLLIMLEVHDVGYSSPRFKTYLFKKSLDFVNEGVSIEDIEKDFDNHISKYWKNDNEIKNILEEYPGNSIVVLNEYLFAKENNIELSLSEDFQIEHIMPQSGKNIDAIRQDADLNNLDEFKEYVEKVGNKIILEEKINKSIGNEWFRSKIQNSVTTKTGYKDSVYPFAKFLVNKYEDTDKPYWRKEDIKNRTDESVERITKFIFG